MMKAGGIAIWLACVALAVGAASLQRATPPQESATGASQEELLGLVRNANTAEAEAFSKGHQYVSLPEVVRRRFAQENWEFSDLGDSSGTFKNYKISLVVSPKGRHYALTLVPVPSEACGLALFSDDSAVIYRGSALGCPLVDLTRAG